MLKQMKIAKLPSNLSVSRARFAFSLTHSLCDLSQAENLQTRNLLYVQGFECIQRLQENAPNGICVEKKSTWGSNWVPGGRIEMFMNLHYLCKVPKKDTAFSRKQTFNDSGVPWRNDIEQISISDFLGFFWVKMNPGGAFFKKGRKLF